MTRRLAVFLAVTVACLFATAAWVSRLLDGLVARAVDTLNGGRA